MTRPRWVRCLGHAGGLIVLFLLTMFPHLLEVMR